MLKQRKKDVVAMCASRRVPLPAVYIKFRAVGKPSEDVVRAIARFEECFGSKQLMHAGSNVNVIFSRR